MALVVAHRGASAAFPPGNTLEAFAAAADLGADWVELDARATADHRIVVHHDPDLADGGVIGSLAAADLPAWVPSLAEAVGACAGLGVNVEIKPDGPSSLIRVAIDAVVALLRSLDEPSRFLVTSFEMGIVDRVRSLAPEIPTGFLTIGDVRIDDSIAEAAAHGHRAVNPWFGFVDAASVARAHDFGLDVNVWTVDEPADIDRLLDDGVDAVITNVPDVCRGIVSRR
jgi:glycerophosphoryl diester phosphodiesterase